MNVQHLRFRNDLSDDGIKCGKHLGEKLTKDVADPYTGNDRNPEERSRGPPYTERGTFCSQVTKLHIVNMPGLRTSTDRFNDPRPNRGGPFLLKWTRFF